MRTLHFIHHFRILFISLLFLSIPQDRVTACEGTSRPPCGQTMWFMILAQRNIAMPQNGQFNIPVVLVPYVFWNTNQGCAQPTFVGNGSAETRTSTILQVEIEVRFISISTGQLMDLGIQSFDLPVPTEPGLQTMNANISVPDGTLDPNDSYIGQFDGTATVNFGAGVGTGVLSASASAQVYVVSRAQGFPDIPVVNIEYVPVMDQDPGYAVCRRGDQVLIHFLVSNNSLTSSVSVNLNTRIGQIAGLPNGFDPAAAQENFDAGVYGIADPAGDYFNHKIVFNPATWETLPEGDPHTNPPSLQAQLTLLAGESQFVAVCIRSFGMCANGSCNKVTLQGEAVFPDGDTVLVCASSALVVDDMNPKSNRCEYKDSIKTSADASACFSKTTFYNTEWQALPHATTNAFGNTGPGSTAGGWWLYGENMVTEPGMFSALSDYIRFDQFVDPGGVSYSVQYSGQASTAINEVEIHSLPGTAGSNVVVPIIRYLPLPITRIIIKPDVDSIYVRIITGDMLVFAGIYSEFLENPPGDFALDLETCRSFQKVYDMSGREICTDIYNFATLHKLNQDPTYSVAVYDQTGAPIQGTVTFSNGFIQPPSQSFDGSFDFNMVKTALPSAPERGYGFLTITSNDALSPLRIPVAASKLGRLELVIVNELDLVNVKYIVGQRGGFVRVLFDPKGGTLPLSGLPGTGGPFDGDGIIMTHMRSRESGVQAIIDGSGCPPPCDVFTFTGDDNEISEIELLDFPQDALTLDGDRNTISSCVFMDNGGSGVVITGGSGNTIIDSRFYNNGGLGIDLGGDGVTANDPADIDTGANHLQNFPILTKAEVEALEGTTIEGEFNSTPNTMFILDFFATDTCNMSGFGEGQLQVADMQITTDDDGNASFSIMEDVISANGKFITATATAPDGSTSEFSACQEITFISATDEPVRAYALRTFPNPVRDELHIEIVLDKGFDTSIELFNSVGSCIATIHEGMLAPGRHLLSTPVRDIAPGLYYIRFQSDFGQNAIKIIRQ